MVFDAFDCLVDHEKGYKNPLTLNDGMAEAILDLNIEASRVENVVNGSCLCNTLEPMQR